MADEALPPLPAGAKLVGAQPGAPPLPTGAKPKEEQQPGGALSAAWNGLLHGLGNVSRGAGQMAGRVGMPGMPNTADLAMRQSRFANDPTTRAHPIATAIGEVGGEMAATAPLGAVGRAAGPIRQALMGAVTGAAGGAVTPVTGGDYWAEKAKQMGAGAAVGGAMGAVGGTMSPQLTPEARMLADRGVRLTPGQAGGWAESERMMQAWPIMRNYVRGLAGRSQDDYNRATVAQALEPINAVVPRHVAAGHDLMDYGRNQLQAAYNRVLPHLQLDGQGVETALANNRGFQQFLSEMAPEDANRLQAILANRLQNRFTQGGGTIDGRVFKEIESDLNNRATGFAGTNSDEIGRGLRQALGIVRNELENQNPRFAPELQRVNAAYAMFDRVRDAAARDAGSRGRFTPRDMLMALRHDDQSAGHGAWGRGAVPMQILAEAADGIIGQSGPLALRRRESITGVLKDFAGGVLMLPPYAAAQAGNAVPGLGRGIAAATPGAGAAAAGAVTGDRYKPIGSGQVRRYAPPDDERQPRPGAP